MKILLRRHGTKNYVWVDATYDAQSFRVGAMRVSLTNIVSVSDDDRKKYVKCSACGAIFKSDSKEIEVHKNRWKDIATCLNCSLMTAYNLGDQKTSYEMDETGKYKRTVEGYVDLRCKARRYYNPEPLLGNVDRGCCRYKACSTAEMQELSDIFFDHPGVFDDIITVDRIIEVGYKSSEASSIHGYYIEYALNGRNNIRAVTNSDGIVDFFNFKYGNKKWAIVYSKKLDKLFTTCGHEYLEWNPADLSDSTKAYVKRKISELYN